MILNGEVTTLGQMASESSSNPKWTECKGANGRRVEQRRCQNLMCNLALYLIYYRVVQENARERERETLNLKQLSMNNQFNL